MKKVFVLVLFVASILGSACALFKYTSFNPNMDMIPRSAVITLVAYHADIEKTKMKDYYSCVESAYVRASKARYGKILASQDQKALQYGKTGVIDPEFMLFSMASEKMVFMDSKERAAPSGYGNFVSHIIKRKNAEYTRDWILYFLRDLTSIQYEQCGENVYTVEERCAALAAVEIEPDWCPK